MNSRILEKIVAIQIVQVMNECPDRAVAIHAAVMALAAYCSSNVKHDTKAYETLRYMVTTCFDEAFAEMNNKENA